jgi:hypothetical protein
LNKSKLYYYYRKKKTPLRRTCTRAIRERVWFAGLFAALLLLVKGRKIKYIKDIHTAAAEIF